MTNPKAKDIYSQHYNTSVVETKALSDQFFPMVVTKSQVPTKMTKQPSKRQQQPK